MHLKAVATGVFAALIALANSQAKATTYDVLIDIDGLTETGKITTDGTIGTLTKSDITSWSFNLVGPNTDTHGPTEISGNAGGLSPLVNSALTTTASGGLYFDFSAGGAGWMFGSSEYLSLSSNGFAKIDYEWGTATQDISGIQEIGVAATPLPAALPLFASGLGALGFLGCRRKRCVVAA
jgi:hypothetical protein